MNKILLTLALFGIILAFFILLIVLVNREAKKYGLNQK
jgi:hypothetical protein